jgi:hypothetical protein
MRTFIRHVWAPLSRSRRVGIITLAAALVSVVPASTYRCNYGMVEAGPLCSYCHGESPSPGAGGSTLDYGPCCSSEIVDSFATSAMRDHSRDIPQTQASDGWLPLSLSPLPIPPIACPRAHQPCPGKLARASAPLILRL